MDTWRVNEGYPDHGIIDQHGHLIAMVTTDEDRPQEPDEVLRNAVLIAAAPELLAVVKGLVFRFAHTADSPEDSEVLDDAHAVIAKAERIIR